MEKKTEMTFRTAREAGYSLHHSSFRRGYISRKLDVYTLPVYRIDNPKSRYNGLHFVDLPCSYSTQYVIRHYLTAPVAAE